MIGARSKRAGEGGEEVLQTLKTEHLDGVLLVRLDRPRRRNAINATMLAELKEVLASAEADDAVRALVITGTDQAFSAGQDLKEEEPPSYVADINSAFDALEALPKPTVAAIDGWCIAGGLEMALCCDVRLAGGNANIGDWHARIDSIGGAGATVRLVRLIGLARAKELVFSGEAVDAERATALGLVTHVYPSEGLVEAAVELARGLCVAKPTTVAYAKKSMNAAADLPLKDALEFSLECQEKVRAALDESYRGGFDGRRDAVPSDKKS